jgi:hypothetical protein
MLIQSVRRNEALLGSGEGLLRTGLMGVCLNVSVDSYSAVGTRAGVYFPVRRLVLASLVDVYKWCRVLSHIASRCLQVRPASSLDAEFTPVVGMGRGGRVNPGARNEGSRVNHCPSDWGGGLALKMGA